MTHARPISGETESILEKTIKGQIHSPVKRFPQKKIPRSLSAVAMKAMAPDMTDRYETVAQLRTEVHSYLAGFATNAENANFFKSLQLFYQRNRTICQTSVSFCILISVLVGEFVYKLNKKTEQAIESKAELENIIIKYKTAQRRVAALKVQKKLAVIQEENKDHIFYHYPMRTVWEKIKLLSTQPKSRSQRNDMAILYLTAQDFKSAITIYREISTKGKHSKAFRICQKYQKLSKTVKNLLTTDGFYQLIKEFPGFKNKELVERLMIYDASARSNLKGYDKVVMAVLSTWNGGLGKSSFAFSIEANKLVLSGSDFKVLGADVMVGGRKSLLFPLQLKKLVVAGTRIHNLNQLRGLDVLEELDIRDTLVTNLSPLKDLPTLQKVTVGVRQFTESELAELTDSITIVVK